MKIFIQELKRGKISLIIWTSIMVFMIAINILLYPQMLEQMEDFSKMLAEMGSFSKAFGLDKLNFGTIIGYIGTECGTTLGLGGGLFAALLGINMIVKEEKDHTAEFLLTHPIKRERILTEKLLALIVQIIFLNIVSYLATIVCVLIIKQDINYNQLTLLYLAYLILQLEIGLICFGISSLLKRNGIGIGIGISIGFYFINITANITDKLSFLKYLTPYSYVEGSDIVNNNAITFKYLIIGIIVSIIFVVLSYLIYPKKDISY